MRWRRAFLLRGWCWVKTIGCNPLCYSWLLIKLFKFSSTFLYDWWYMHLCGQYISGPILFMIVDLCSSIVLCCFDPTGALWSWVDKGKRQRSVRRERNQARNQAQDWGWCPLFPSYLLLIKESESSFSLFVSKIATSLITKWRLHWGERIDCLFVYICLFYKLTDGAWSQAS